MADLWREVPKDLLEAINTLSDQEFTYIEKIEVAALPSLTPNQAREIFEGLSDEIGDLWAIVSSCDSASVCYGSVQSWPSGGILEGEAVLNCGATLKLQTSANNGLTLFAYATTLKELPKGLPALQPLESLRGLLRETKTFLGTRSNTNLSYDVYWQVAGDFGLRERLSILSGVRG